MRFSTFALGMSAALPGTFIYVMVGTSIKDIHDAIHDKESLYQTSPAAFIFVVCTTVIALGALIWASIITKRHFDLIIEKASEHPDDEEENYHEEIGPDAGSNRSIPQTESD